MLQTPALIGLHTQLPAKSFAWTLGMLADVFSCWHRLGGFSVTFTSEPHFIRYSLAMAHVASGNSLTCVAAHARPLGKKQITLKFLVALHNAIGPLYERV